MGAKTHLLFAMLYAMMIHRHIKERTIQDDALMLQVYAAIMLPELCGFFAVLFAVLFCF